MPVLDPTKPVSLLIDEHPEWTKLLDDLGIDYCCGGHRPLAEACSQAGLTVEALGKILDSAPPADPTRQAGNPALTDASITKLVDHIEATHHAFLRSELPRLDALVRKVIAAHGDRHHELAEIQSAFLALVADLEPHMMKEEHILFPLCRELDTATGPQAFHCGSVGNPIRVMLYEHDQVGDILRRIRALTSDYKPPADACTSFRLLYEGLEALEHDLHVHIHKENNLLFPRVLEREAALDAR